jgi:hypothetical protein
LGPIQVWLNDVLMPGYFDINSIDPLSVVSVELYEDANQGAGAIRITTTLGLPESDPRFGRNLKEVKIKAFKENNNYPSSVLGGPGNADQVIHRSDMSQGGDLSDQLDGRLTGGVKMVGRPGAKGPVLFNRPLLVVIDGAIINPRGELVNLDEHITLSTVETVEILRSGNASIYGMSGGNGVMVITTRTGANADPKDISSIGILPITVQGFYKAREFYSPKYEASMPVTQHDLRSTIYWAPELVTGKDGNASIDFYNADGKGNYRVVVEGVDEKGNIGRSVYRYKVE